MIEAPLRRYLTVSTLVLLAVIALTTCSWSVTQQQIDGRRLETAWILLIVAAIGFVVANMVVAIVGRGCSITARGLQLLCAVGFWVLVAATIVGIWQLTVNFWQYNSSPFPVLLPASMALGLLYVEAPAIPMNGDPR